MLPSTATSTANDVNIKCRIRRSPTAHEPQYGECQSATCTMRNWEKCRKVKRRSNSMLQKRIIDPADDSGPELLFTPLTDIISQRDDSPVRRSSSFRQRPTTLHRHRSSSGGNNNNNSSHDMDSTISPRPVVRPFSIPIAQILLVETAPASSSSQNQSMRTDSSNTFLLHLTTQSLGYFEVDCIHNNGHDILLAFLQASVEPERWVDRVNEELLLHAPSSCCDASELDVDALTEQHVHRNVENESWPEKWSRRMHKMVSSLSEISGTLCSHATCCGQDEQAVRDLPPPPSSSSASREHHDEQVTAVEQQRRYYTSYPHYHDLEMADEASLSRESIAKKYGLAAATRSTRSSSQDEMVHTR